jgi:WD40 repeat protein
VRATRAEENAVASEKQESLLRRQAELEGEHARRENAAARVNEYVADINLAFHAVSDGHLGRAVHLLDKLRPAANQTDLRGFEWRYLWQLCRGDEHLSFPDQDGPVQSMTVSPDGSLLAVGVRDKIEVWNLSSHSKVNSISCAPSKGPGSSFRPGPPDRSGGAPFPFRGGEGAAFISGGFKMITSGMGNVRIWNTTDWKEMKNLQGAAGPVAVSADGSRLAAMKGDFPDRRTVAIWDTTNWTELRSIAGATGPIALSADGKWLAANSDKGIAVWQVDNPETPVLLENSTNVFSRGGPRFTSDHILAISPDANYFVAARNTVSERGVFVLSIWDAKSGKEIAVLPDDPEHVEHTGSISCLAFSPDGKMLATASLDYSIRLWDFAKRERIATLQGHLSEVWSLAFLPDGQSLVSGAKDGSVKIWSTSRKAPADVLARASTPLAFSSDGRTLAAFQQQNSIALLDLETGQVERSIQLESGRGFRGGFRPRPGQAVTISADLRKIAQGIEDGIVKIWDTPKPVKPTTSRFPTARWTSPCSRPTAAT